MNIDLQDLGLRMKFAREKENRKRKAKREPEIKQTDMAQRIQVGTSTISEWEQGKKHPGFLNVVNYCKVLGITPDLLLGMETPKQLLSVDVTEEERDAMFSMLEECQHETDLNTLHGKIQFFQQHLKALFSRAQSK